MNYILTADGGSRGNPGPSAYGFAVWKSEASILDKQQILQILASENPIFKAGKYIGHATNNQAEWSGLIAGLEYLSQNQSDLSEIFVALDSDLVVKQISGIYKVKNLGLQTLFIQAKQVLELFKAKNANFQFLHIYREFNKIADAEVNKALDSL